MKKFLYLFLCAVLSFTVAFCLSGCSSRDNGQSAEKLSIVTTLFPQYDFAQKIAGDRAEVRLLLSPGVEAHSYDPTVRDITAIGQSDLFIYTGDQMEPWVQKVMNSASMREQNQVINLSEGIDLKEDIDGDDKDPHMWLDMKNAVTMVEKIEKALVEKMPESKELFEGNAAELKQQLLELDGEFSQTIQNAGQRSVVFGGRFAYTYFTDAYNLNYKTVYTSCTTDVEPSSRTVAEITDYIKQNDIKYIFHEELADPKVARSIADATGCELLEFSTGHNLSKIDFDNRVSFVDIMKRNLENLKKGLLQ